MTTDLRDRIVTIIAGLRAVDYDEIFPSDYETADALIAALPSMVLPLEWTQHNEKHWALDDGYLISKTFKNEPFDLFTTSFMGNPIAPLKDSIEAAKAAANAHHRAQIMAAFGISKECVERRHPLEAAARWFEKESALDSQTTMYVAAKLRRLMGDGNDAG